MIRRRTLVALVVACAAAEARAATVTIARDRWGVPHVFVPPEGNRVTQLRVLGMAFGYAQAQDRMFQLELSRRIATGRLAELSPPYFQGAAVLPQDIAVRRDGLTLAERHGWPTDELREL